MIQAPLTLKIAVATTATHTARAVSREGIRRTRSISRSVAPRGHYEFSEVNTPADYLRLLERHRR